MFQQGHPSSPALALLSALTLTLVPSPAAEAADPRLLADLLPGTTQVGDSAVLLPETATLDGRVYFAAHTHALGGELWSTDGTAEGTAVVRDLCPGRCSSDARSPVRAGDAVYFTAAGPFGHLGRRLFRTDGSVAGTEVVAPVGDGLGLLEPTALTAAGDRLFFLAGKETATGLVQRLWSTDGTRAGTRLVAGLCGGGCGSNPVSLLTADGDGGLYFAYSRRGGPSALWHAPAGGGPAIEIATPPHGVAAIAAGPGEVAFSTGERELWLGEPTPGSVVPLTDTFPGYDLRVVVGPRRLASGGFAVLATAGIEDYELWVATRASEPRRLLNLGPADLAFVFELVSTDSLSFFTTLNGSGTHLWTTDGTVDGTRMLPLPPNPSLLLSLRRGDGQVVFRGQRFLGVTDGTTEGTRLILESELPAEIVSFGEIAAVPGGAIFVGVSPQGAYDAWWTDLTVAGTHRLTDHGEAPESSAPEHLTASGDVFLFAARASEGAEADELWRSGPDDLAPLAQVPFSITAIDGRAPALVAGPSSLYRTDGTAAGTTLLAPVGAFARFERFAGARYFAGSGEGGIELWRTDATTVGTALVRDIDPNTPDIPHSFGGSSFPTDLVSLGKRLVFSAERLFDRQLWASDGSEAGTVALTALEAPPPGALPAGLTRVPSRPRRAVFAITGGDGDRELWRTDGTADGTRLLADLASAGSSDPRDFLPLGSRVLFIATPSQRDALFRTDGTQRGTRRVTNLALDGEPATVPGPRVELEPALDRFQAAAGGRAFFVAFHPTTGNELWVSDGTRAGTHLLVDLLPGPAGSDPGAFRAIDGRLVFAADDGVHGRELWVSDGTLEGTRLLADVAPGAAGSNPVDPAAAGDVLAFVADDGVTGRELWAVDRAALIVP